MGPKTEKDLLPKVSREKRGTINNEVSRQRSVLDSFSCIHMCSCFSSTAVTRPHGDMDCSGCCWGSCDPRHRRGCGCCARQVMCISFVSSFHCLPPLFCFTIQAFLSAPHTRLPTNRGACTYDNKGNNTSAHKHSRIHVPE